MRVFVYEYLSAGGDAGFAPDGADLLAQGRAMRDAIVADLAAVDGVATTYASTAQDRHSAPGATPVASRAREGAEAFVRRQAASHDRVWVVAPETDAILARLRASVADSRWIGCGADAIRIAGSKRATAAALRRSGVAVARVAEDAETPGGPGARWVVKPDDGAGACDTRLYATLAEALADHARREAQGRSTVVERWEEGAPLSLSLLCNGGGVEVLSVNRQRIEIDVDGWVRYRGVVPNTHDYAASGEVLEALAGDVVRAMPGLCGYVGIDLVLRHDGRPVVIEVNPRVTCAYVGLSAALGRNIARDVLACHAAALERARV